MTPERFRVVVSTVLIVGVTTSAILMVVGFVGSLLVGWEGSLAGAGPGPGPVTDFGQLLAELGVLRPIGIVQLGLAVLVATPVVRVAASVVGFLLEDDLLYAAITGAVLVVLLASIFLLH